MERTRKRLGRKPIIVPIDELPNRARPLRESLGITLTEMAERIGCGANSLSEFELHGTGLGRMKLYNLADKLGVDYGILVTPGKKYAENIRQRLDNYSVPAV